MKKKIAIIKAELIENDKSLLLGVEDGVSISELKPAGQMLVDSDNLSFIYIADNDDDYTYLIIPHLVWPEIKKAFDLNVPVYLTDQHEHKILPQFHEELGYLIENIKGNSNYGEEMVEKVESTF